MLMNVVNVEEFCRKFENSVVQKWCDSLVKSKNNCSTKSDNQPKLILWGFHVMFE